ncbi:forkhead-associated protein [Mycobacterium sp. ITM-2016-00318]|uniref:forkhead-associated protein n=1 Tax=Mycobacterium sp. ITM-2016-00318 TaxID=2099693 RepID=UPI000CF98CCF|nr:forkhead-associated protein [Mycobacterium sp. ITM-2016-00318]WNG92841.1 XRE family transcriptional regulator [Mycobacterium sp. ITM-2016-00318]
MGQSVPQDDSSIIVSLSEAAMHMYSAAIDALPFAEDKKFHKRADVVLEGMRKLRTALADAASTSRPSSAVIVELSNVRRRYDLLIEHAAAAPGSSLGQQLYVTRVHAKLSAEEVANGAGLPTRLPDELEAGGTPNDDQAAKIRDTIVALGGVPGTEHHLYHDPEPGNDESEHHDHDEHHVNGHEEQFAEEHAG